MDIRRGWPIPSMLDVALASGNDVLVRVYPEPGMTRNTSRFVMEWRDTVHVDPTLTAAVSGSSVTFGGTGDPSNVAGIMVGPPYGSTYAYRLGDTDGPDQVAAAFQTQIGGSTSVIGPVVTLATNQPIVARVVADQRQSLELRRQDQGFRVSIWSANYAARDAVAAAIDNATASLSDNAGGMTMFLPLADGTAGWLRYRATYNLDNAEKAGLYRRDLCYTIEYATSLSQTFSALLFGVTDMSIDLNTPGTVPEILVAPTITLTA